MGPESSQPSVLLSQFGDLLMVGGVAEERELLGAWSPVVEAGCLAVLWLMSPCLVHVYSRQEEG